jgi:hypothetical protein
MTSSQRCWAPGRARPERRLVTDGDSPAVVRHAISAFGAAHEREFAAVAAVRKQALYIAAVFPGIPGSPRIWLTQPRR